MISRRNSRPVLPTAPDAVTPGSSKSTVRVRVPLMAASEPGGPTNTTETSQTARQLFQQISRAGFTLRAVFPPVEVGALLGHLQACTLALRVKLDGRERYRQLPLADVHVVSIDDALVWNDVEIERVESVGRAALGAAPQHLATADAEVEFPLLGQPFTRSAEPFGLALEVGEGRKHALGRGFVVALDEKGGVNHAAVFDDAHAHFLGFFLVGSEWCAGLVSARNSPNLSSRRSQASRRSPIQCCAVRSASPCIRQVRTRPTFSERTRPLVSST